MVTTIIFDFDGVILDSMPIRKLGFAEVLKDFPTDKVGELLEYHERNGGLSRYHKFEYFYTTIIKQEFSQEDILRLADAFSVIMRAKLTDKAGLIDETIRFIQENKSRYRYFIASGSDENELRFLCKELGIHSYFEAVFGSPTPKKQIVGNLLKQYEFDPDEAILIGDAFNDFEAASVNQIDFYGFNNPTLQGIGKGYIHSFQTFSIS